MAMGERQLLMEGPREQLSKQGRKECNSREQVLVS